jgi:hypothetical protein
MLDSCHCRIKKFTKPGADPVGEAHPACVYTDLPLRPVNVYLRFKLQDKYNTCAVSKHIGKYVYSARNAGKGSAKSGVCVYRLTAFP